MLTEPCVMFFSPCRAVLSAILRDEYLTLAVRTKEGDKAGSNQPPARDPVQFTLELTPNYLISYLENTGSRSTRYVSMPHPNESSVLPKFLEKSDPEVARPAFSTWPVQKTQPKALRYARRFKSTNQCNATKETSLCGVGLWFCTANSRDTLIGGFESTRIPQIPLEHPEVSCLLTGFLGWVSLYVVGITNMKRSLITFHLLLLDFFSISILINYSQHY